MLNKSHKEYRDVGFHDIYDAVKLFWLLSWSVIAFYLGTSSFDISLLSMLLQGDLTNTPVPCKDTCDWLTWEDDLLGVTF